MDSIKSDPFWRLSVSWMAMDTTAMPLAAAESPSIVLFKAGGQDAR